MSRFEAILRSRDKLTTLKAWRKRGPVGKLHNLIIHARATPLRHAFFASKHKEANGGCERLYQLVINGGIRWNSTFDVIERALKLKDALELYQHRYRHDDDESVEGDVLTSDDWIELKDIYNLLSPLKEASLSVQSDGKNCKHDSLFENLQAIDWLLHKLEELRTTYCHLPSTYFKASIKLGWKKLDKYYKLSDNTTAYRAAIALYPKYKISWFEEKWSDTHPQWIVKARAEIKALYNEYKRQHGDEVVPPTTQPSKELT